MYRWYLTCICKVRASLLIFPLIQAYFIRKMIWYLCLQIWCCCLRCVKGAVYIYYIRNWVINRGIIESILILYISSTCRRCSQDISIECMNDIVGTSKFCLCMVCLEYIPMQMRVLYVPQTLEQSQFIRKWDDNSIVFQSFKGIPWIK